MAYIIIYTYCIILILIKGGKSKEEILENGEQMKYMA